MIKCGALSFLAFSLLYTVHGQEPGKINNKFPEDLFLSETILGIDEQMVAPRGTNNLRRGLQESVSNVCRSSNSFTAALPDITGLKCEQLPKYECTCSASADTTCNYCTLRTNPQFVLCQVSGSVMRFRDESGISTTCSCEYVGNGIVEQRCYDQQGVSVPVPGATTTPGGESSATTAPVANPTDPPVSPTKSPVDDGTPAPVPVPTVAPIVPTNTIAPVAAPTSAPITPTTTAPVVSPTRAPITPTAAPVVPGTSTPVSALPISGGQNNPGAQKGGPGRSGGGGVTGRFGGFW